MMTTAEVRERLNKDMTDTDRALFILENGMDVDEFFDELHNYPVLEALVTARIAYDYMKEES